MLSRAINAKNSLNMHSGFSLYQMLFGQQPNLQSVLTDKPAALPDKATSGYVAKHINAMHITQPGIFPSSLVYHCLSNED